MKFSVACNNGDMHDFKPRLAIWCQVTRADRQPVDRVAVRRRRSGSPHTTPAMPVVMGWSM